MDAAKMRGLSKTWRKQGLGGVFCRAGLIFGGVSFWPTFFGESAAECEYAANFIMFQNVKIGLSSHIFAWV